MLMVVIKLVYLHLFDSLQATKLYSCTAPLLLQELLRQMQLVDRHVSGRGAEEKSWGFSSGNARVVWESRLRKRGN